ncbi:hypothetical protein Fmac_001075 [Flemingia macrophylla]|uniref:Bidirectional sugar transporter SWEET n=1 Tax=Flemingia macrophylla TaxID=520843 RepID=A0ABD1NIV2_9FABA
MLLITINSFGCVIETIYLAIFLTYGSKKARISTLRMIVLLNFGGFCTIVLITRFLAKEHAGRVKLLGWICVVFATSVFAAPLCIIRVVIRTKSVEFLPFPLSLLLLISAIMWLLYGICLKDIYVTLPNVVGLTFGVIQIVLFAMYRKNKPVEDQKLPEHIGEIEKEGNVGPSMIYEKQEPELKSLDEGEGDIEIGENKKEENQDEESEKKHEDQAEPNNNKNTNNNNNNDITRERENCEV